MLNCWCITWPVGFKRLSVYIHLTSFFVYPSQFRLGGLKQIIISIMLYPVMFTDYFRIYNHHNSNFLTTFTTGLLFQCQHGPKYDHTHIRIKQSWIHNDTPSQSQFPWTYLPETSLILCMIIRNYPPNMKSIKKNFSSCILVNMATENK